MEIALTCAVTTLSLIAGQHFDIGTLEIATTDTHLSVTYNLTDGWAMTESHLQVGTSLEDFPLTKQGNPQIGRFDYTRAYDPAATTDTFTIALDAIPGWAGCGNTKLLVGAHAAVMLYSGGEPIQGETAWSEGTGFPGRSWAMFSTHDAQCCPIVDPPAECGVKAGDYRTQTQGGWGSTANGNNPGAYRDLWFDKAFKETGLVIGDTSQKYTATFSSSEAVESFLPQGGPTGVFDASYYDATKTSAGVFAGQLTALQLSASFDAIDPDFSKAEAPLTSLRVADEESACYGLSVEELLKYSHTVISGGASTFSAGTLSGCLDQSNNAFVDGEKSSGYLCK